MLFSENLLNYITSNEWREYMKKQLVFMNSKSNTTNEDASYYSCLSNSMFFNVEDKEEGDKIWTMLHEYGHYISYNAFNSKGHICNTLTIIFEKEVSKKNIRNQKQGLKFLYNLKEELYSTYELDLIYPMARTLSPISDGLGMCLNASYIQYGFRGHNEGYSTLHLGTELFAELFAMTVMGDNIGLSIFKREFPKTYYYANEKINSLRK